MAGVTGHQRAWVVLIDGAEHELDLIRAEAARRAVTVHIVIDLIHLADDPTAEDWVAAKTLAVALQAGWPIAKGVIEGACKAHSLKTAMIGGGVGDHQPWLNRGRRQAAVGEWTRRYFSKSSSRMTARRMRTASWSR